MASDIGEGPIYARVDISAGTYVTNDMISVVKSPPVVGASRRVTIGVNITAALAGRLRPGDVVDIGFVSTGQETSVAEIVAFALPVLELLNDQVEPIMLSMKKENQYDTGVRIPAMATLVVNSPEQGIMIKEREARGKLFFMGY
jgi:pilus assembly protein CpaB